MLMALSALGFGALPSIASAFETVPAISPVEGEFPVEFEGSGEAVTLYTATGAKISCEASANSGSFTDAHTGSIQVTLTGCRESFFASSCTTSGQATGTIVTKTLSTHTVYLKPTGENPHETPGLLFTPNEEGKVAEFSCVGGFVKIVVKGNGMLGTVTGPELEGEASETFEVSIGATAEGQEHTETVESEEFGLESSTNGGAFEPAYLSSPVCIAVMIGGVLVKTILDK